MTRTGSVAWCAYGALACVTITATARADDDASDLASQCVRASEQGQSERDQGRYRAARAAFIDCARDTCPAVVAKVCAKWLRDVDDAVPTLVLGARDEDGNDLAEVTVTLDGAPFASRLVGQPSEVDSGEHVLRFERAGHLPVEQRLIVRAGEKARAVTVILRRLPEDAPPGSAPTPTAIEPLLSARHVTSGGLLVAGIASAGVGLYLTVRANQDAQSAANLRGGLPSNACTPGLPTTGCQTLSDTVRAEHAETNTATALYVAAGALGASAIAAWLLWPGPSATPPPASAWISPVPRGALLQVVGRLP
jgi:hypothetical protein